MRLALFGYGGHAREVALQINKPVEFFVDDEYVNEFTKPISEFNPETHMMMVAVADSQERKRIVEKLPKETTYFTFIHPTAIIMDNNVEIGNGSFIGVNSILTTNIKIGSHALLNRSVQIGHDCKIGDYLSCMPGVIISGNNTIGDYVYFGAGSVTKEKLNITSGVTIGLNSGVIKDIVVPGTYVGTPVKKIY